MKNDVKVTSSTAPVNSMKSGEIGATGETAVDHVGPTDEWSTMRLLSTAARLWERRVNTSLSRIDLSQANLIALQALAETGTTNQATLARRIQVSAQTLGRTLKTLEKRGYVQRSPGAVGQRGIHVSTTQAGREALASVRTTHGENSPEDTLGADAPGHARATTPIEDLREDLIRLLTTIAPRSASQ
jgi:DNA-binding MarR family transcriptional regulator